MDPSLTLSLQRSVLLLLIWGLAWSLIGSRECPGQVLLETLEHVPEWVKAGRVIVSGFHSPLEQQPVVFQSQLEAAMDRGLSRQTISLMPDVRSWMHSRH